VVFGILDWLSDIVYVQAKTIDNTGLKNAVKGFIILQPIFYLFIHTIYMGSHQDIQTLGQRVRLILLSPVYAIL
jgi:hypothetical protein